MFSASVRQPDAAPLPGRESADQPSPHYLFLDLDSLLAAVKTHVQAQPTVYHSTDGVMLHPERLTTLLEGSHRQLPQQPAIVLCRHGSFFNVSQDNARALQAVGWDLKKKGALEHRTLENMLERHLEFFGTCNSWGPQQTMVLATGELTPPTLGCLQAYLLSGWCVKVFTLQRCWKSAFDELSRAFQSRFCVVYLDLYLKQLLAGVSPVVGPVSAAASPRVLSLLSRIAINGRSNTQQTLNARALGLATAINYRSSHQEALADEYSSKTREQNAVERRQGRLLKLPGSYSAGHRERYIFLNVDNIAGALFTSHALYQQVDGATSPRDVRLNFKALTELLCGNGASVKYQLATYSKTPPYLARALLEFGWLLKPLEKTGVDDKTLHYELMSQLANGATTSNEKALVLAMGDGGLGASINKATAYREIICKFLEHQWCVEIHAWLHSLNDGFIDLQMQHPGRVVVKPLDNVIRGLVYLKKQGSERGTMLNPEASNQNERTSPMPLPVARFFAPASPSPPPPPQPMESTVTALQQQLKQMQDAFAALQTDLSTQQRLKQQNEELERHVREKEREFEEERSRQAAIAAQQASDARLARRLALEDREESLMCPITYDLYVDPVTTVCCGKTFSGKALADLRALDEYCPWCRQPEFATHPNRDVAQLVAQYRAEKIAFDAEEVGQESKADDQEDKRSDEEEEDQQE